MSAVDLAVERLKVDEGFRSVAYRDSVNKLTIGYGFCIDAGISQTAAGALLTAQTEECLAALAGFWWAQGLDDIRMSVLVELAYNNGVAGLLHYPKMLAAIGAKNWQAAHDELLDSDAARMLAARYGRFAQVLLTGNLNA